MGLTKVAIHLHCVITRSQSHYDNFTIPLAELGWLGLTGMIIIAVYYRRKNYELFYYTHHFAIAFLIICCLHAWTFWSASRILYYFRFDSMA